MYKVFFLSIILMACSLQLAASDDLRYAVLNPSKVDSLNLSGQSIPDSLDWSSMKNLTYLNLSNCSIEHLDSSIAQLENLNHLILDGNVFHDLNENFKWISQIESLKKLSLANCFLLFLPNSIAELKSLESLNLSGNYLFDLPKSFHDLIRLETLNLSKNNLDTLSFAFVKHKHLSHLNLSYNKHLEKVRAIEVCAQLLTLEKLELKGWDTIPTDLIKLKQIESLDLSDGNFYTLPNGMGGLKSLSSLSVLSDKVFWDQMIEKILYCPELTELTIGGCGLKNIPFNLTKLKNLKHLRINESVIWRVPSRISSMRLSQLSLTACFIKDISSLSQSFTAIKNMERIDLSDCQFNPGTLRIGRSKKWKGMIIQNCNMSGITIAPNQEKWVVEAVNCSGLEEMRSTKNIQLSERSTSTHVLKSKYALPAYYHLIQPKEATVYGEVGLVIDITKNILLDIPEKAFVDDENNSIEGEVEVLVYQASKAKEQLKYGIECQMAVEGSKYYGIATDLNIMVEAFQEGKRLHLNEGKSISVKWYNGKGSKKLYTYDDKEGLLELESALRGDSLICYRSQEPSTLDDVYEEFVESKPLRKSNIRHSQVYLKVKKGRRNKPFHFYLEPEYGFNEKYIPLLGNRIKAYSEFRAYKGIRWNYMGTNQSEDYEKLYKLTDIKPERLRKKSSLYLYVLDLNDITLKPSSSGDYYDFTMARGFDTLNLSVLPNLALTNAKKVQKWHRNKYKKYRSLLSVREEKWHKLDSLDLSYEDDYYNELNDFRELLISKYQTKTRQPLLEQYEFQLDLNQVYVIGKEFDQQFEYIKVDSIKQLDMNRVEAFTSISENGKSIQCSMEQIAIVGSNMTVVVHFKNGSVASFNYEDGEVKDYVEGKDLKDVVVW